MPTLKQFHCSVKCPDNDLTLSEYGASYADGEVNCYLRVPDERTRFCIQVKSQGYIAPGLAVFVYIDGVYACNRNRQNLKFAKSGDAASVEEVDFTFRQLERFQDNGRLWGRPWAFKKIPDEEMERAKLKVETSSSNRTWGSIEVIVLRCHGQDEPRDILSAFGPPPDPAVLRLKSQKGMWKFVHDDQGLDLNEEAHTKQKAPLGYDGADDRSHHQSPQKKLPSHTNRPESRKPHSKVRSAHDTRDDKRSKDRSSATAKVSHSHEVNGHSAKDVDGFGTSTRQQVSRIKSERGSPPPRQQNGTPEPYMQWNSGFKKQWSGTKDLYEWSSPDPAAQPPKDNSAFQWWNGDNTPSQQSNVYSSQRPEPLQGFWNDEPIGYSSMLGVPQSESPVQMAHDQIPSSGNAQDKSVDTNLSHYVAKEWPARYTHTLSKPTYIDSLNAPYARFIFKYRNKTIIEETLNIVIDDFEAIAKQECESKSREELITELVAEKKHAEQLRLEKEQAEEAAKGKDSAKITNFSDVDEQGFLQTSLGKKIDHFIGQLEGKFGDFPWAKKAEGANTNGDNGVPSTSNNPPPGWAHERNPKDEDKAEGAPVWGGWPPNANQSGWNNAEHRDVDTKADASQSPQWGGSYHQKTQDKEQKGEPNPGWGGSSNQKEYDKKENIEPSSAWANNDWPASGNEGKDSTFQNNLSQQQASSSKFPNAQEDRQSSRQSKSDTHWIKHKSTSNQNVSNQHSPRHAVQWGETANSQPLNSDKDNPPSDSRAPESAEHGNNSRGALNHQNPPITQREPKQTWGSTWDNNGVQDKQWDASGGGWKQSGNNGMNDKKAETKRLHSPVIFKGNTQEEASRDYHSSRSNHRSRTPNRKRDRVDNAKRRFEGDKNASMTAEPSDAERAQFYNQVPAVPEPKRYENSSSAYVPPNSSHQNNEQSPPHPADSKSGLSKNNDTTTSVPGAWPSDTEPKADHKGKENEPTATSTGITQQNDDIANKFSGLVSPQSPSKGKDDGGWGSSWRWSAGRKSAKEKGKEREDKQEEKAWGEGWNTSPRKQGQEGSSSGNRGFEAIMEEPNTAAAGSQKGWDENGGGQKGWDESGGSKTGWNESGGGGAQEVAW